LNVESNLKFDGKFLTIPIFI